jgi:hypothetical protein
MVFQAVLQLVGPMLLELVIREVAVPAVKRIVRSETTERPVDVLTPRFQALSTVQVVSDVPGRLRVDVVGLRGQTELACKLTDVVASLDGVTRAEANPKTGRLLVTFDAARQTVPALVSAIDGGRSAHLQQSASRNRHLAAVV